MRVFQEEFLDYYEWGGFFSISNAELTFMKRENWKSCGFRCWPTHKVCYPTFPIISQNSKSCICFKCKTLLNILIPPKFWNFQKFLSSQNSLCTYIFSTNEKIIIVLSLYFGCKSNKHNNLMLCIFQHPELAKKDAAFILKIFPFLLHRIDVYFLLNRAGIEFGQILKGIICVYPKFTPYSIWFLQMIWV